MIEINCQQVNLITQDEIFLIYFQLAKMRKLAIFDFLIVFYSKIIPKNKALTQRATPPSIFLHQLRVHQLFLPLFDIQ